MPSQVVRANNFNQTLGGGGHLTKFRMRNSRGQYQSIEVGGGDPNQIDNNSTKMPSIGLSTRGSVTAGGSTRRQHKQ
jgi:hypothetical protein